MSVECRYDGQKTQRWPNLGSRFFKIDLAQKP